MSPRAELGIDVATLVEQVADTFPAEVAIRHGDVTVTWQELDERAGRFAAFAADSGVGPDDRVAIGLPNCPEYLVALLGTLKAGGVPVNVNFRYRAAELAHVLEDSGAKVLVHGPSLAGAVAELRSSGSAPVAVTVGSPDGPTFDEAIDRAPLGRDVPRSEDWVLYTGGTTGMPKGMVRAQASVVDRALAGVTALFGEPYPTSVEDYRAVLRRHSGDRPVALVAPPLMHGTGIYSAIGAWAAGGTVVLPDMGGYDPAHVAGLLESLAVDELYVVGDAFCLPLVDELDRAKAEGHPYDLGRLKRVRSVGAVWSAEVKARLLTHADARLTDVVAATEGGPYALAVCSRATPRAEYTTFRLAPGCVLLGPGDEVVDPATGGTGELAAPAYAGSRYLGDPERSARIFRTVGGTTYSAPGDLARLDAEGRLQLLGRGSGVINTGGEKVYPGEVEDVLREHPAVRDAIVIGVPDSRWGTAVTAVVEVEPGTTVEVEDLRRHVAGWLAAYKQPRHVAIVDELRRTASGKADLRWARRQIDDAS